MDGSPPGHPLDLLRGSSAGTKVSRVVFVSGRPASGKGTLCERIAKEYGLVHISPGEILRTSVRDKTPLGERARPYMERGELVPDDVVVGLVYKRLCRSDVLLRGCLLDNFPLTQQQAEAVAQWSSAASFQLEVRLVACLVLDAPLDVCQARAEDRLIDEQTGSIHSRRSLLASVAGRLRRRDDDKAELVVKRLETHDRHAESCVSALRCAVHRFDASRDAQEVFEAAAEVIRGCGWGYTEDEPYFGSKAFGQAFSALLAERAGFHCPDSPPTAGDQVVCFRRGPNLMRVAEVLDMEERASDGSRGLLAGTEGLWVTLRTRDKSKQEFGEWSAFLAPADSHSYSSLCTSEKFERTAFAARYSCSRGLGDADVVEAEAARAAAEAWLRRVPLEDDEEEPVEIEEEKVREVLAEFDSHPSPSIYLYSAHIKLGEQTTGVAGKDFSIYYRALNNGLNNDDAALLDASMPLLQHMIHEILYLPDGQRRLHAGGRLYKGDVQRPVPINLQKLFEGLEMDTAVRFRQFLSTSTDEKMADKYRKRSDGRGFFWTIDVPTGFWGAWDIANVAWRRGEAETLFPPYAAFRVLYVDHERAHLQALDRSSELGERALRNGIKGTAVELIDY